MIHRIFILILGVLLLPHGLRAASSAAPEKEYQQVRTIALRDARVQSAYRDADRRLDAKIIQIDPALESYVKAKQASREGVPAPKVQMKPFTVAKPVAKTASVKPAVAGKSTHVVAAGETLNGIAKKYRVSVGALKDTNQIKDERKLRVGQALTIPSGKPGVAAKKDESGWSRLMH
jgi:LysM repeat protein